MKVLLSNYKNGTVPSFEEIRLGDEGLNGFDGSFGWW